MEKVVTPKFKQNKVALVSSFFGNSLEFYDFTLYGMFAGILAPAFFPSSNPTISLIASWGAFAAGFFMRPIGGLLFGFIGDLWGRKTALSFSVLLMAVPTLIIAALPTYADIGLFAPLALVFCRLLQGLSTGGEYNGSAIFSLEHFNNKKPGFIGGIITSSCVFGALMATYFGKLAIGSSYTFAWRIPFVIGGVFGLLIFGFRFLLQETPAYIKDAAADKQKDRSFHFIFDYYKVFLANFSIGALNGCLSYVLFGFSSMYLSRYCSVEKLLAIDCSMVGLFFFMTFSPIAGMIFDRLGYARYFYTAVISTAVLIIPSFLLLQTASIPTMVVGFIVLGIVTASIAGPCHAFMQTYVPVNVRYRVVALSFSLGMGIIGGITPMVLTAVMDNEHYRNLNAPAYLVLMVTFGFYLLTKMFLNSLDRRQGSVLRVHPKAQSVGLK